MSGDSADSSAELEPSVGSVLSRPAEEFANDPLVESLWLSKAVTHMEVYFNLITSLPSLKTLKLTKNDDIIYKTFREQFPDLDIKSLTEDSIKCEEAKTKWRQFCNDMQELIEEFNFATLLRLDSKSDYSESNTVVVPRAQFVAIEVARNREGLNDGLNELFKKLMANTMFDEFFDDLNVFLTNFAENNNLPDFLSDFRPIMNRENGTKIRGDFSLNFVSPKYHLWHKYLPQICDQLMSESPDWKTYPIESFKINDKISRIILFVNRSKAVPKVIHKFSDILLKNRSNLVKSHIICVLFDVKNKFSAERIRKVSESVSKLLDRTYVDFNYEKISNEMFDELLSSAESSVFCESNVNNKLIFKQNLAYNGSTDQANNILIDKTSKMTFELIWNLYEFVTSHLKCEPNDTIVLIISESVCYRMKQSFRLMCLLYDLKLNLKLISVSNVTTDRNFDDYIQSLSDHLMEQNDSSFESSDNFQIIIETSVTLSLLSTTISSVVTHLDPHLSESTFIQYNCARLKAIINRYNCEFESNPANNSLDLSLLTHDLEWSLIFNQFSNYYSIINSLNNYFDLSINQKVFGLNQLILFLKGFVSEVSVYYKKVKVLTEPSPHLLSLIAVRIHFCQLLLNLFINCLNILGLKTVEKL